MRILLLNHQQNKTAAGQVWLSHSTAIYLTSPTLSFLICKVEMGFTPTRVPSKPGSGLPAQSRVWRPCRWQVLQSLSVQRSNRCQPSLASRGHCHAMQTVPASACRTGSSPQGGPPVLTAVWRRCAIQHPSPFQRGCLIPWTGSLGLHSGQLSDSGGSRSPQPCDSS